MVHNGRKTKRRWSAVIGLLLIGTAPAHGETGRYVSLGSSYAAGPGVGTPDPAAGACLRSSSNYARLIAERLKVDLVDVSCSGATTANILVSGQHDFPAQIEAVSPETALVSILIGGNDIGYVANLRGLSCRKTGQFDCEVLTPAEIDRRLVALPAALDRVVAEVRRRAPRAVIVLVGYLPAVPDRDDSACEQLALSSADIREMRAAAARLNGVIRDGARRAGIRFVDAGRYGSSKGVCSTRPLISGYKPPRMPGWPAAIAYHPTQAGMDRVAAGMLKLIRLP